MTTVIRSLGYAKLLLALLDVIVLLLVAALIVAVRDHYTIYSLTTNEAILFATVSVASVLVFREFHLYKHRVFSSGSDQIVNLGKGVLWLGIIALLRMMARQDPLMRRVYGRHIRYRNVYRPTSSPWRTY